MPTLGIVADDLTGAMDTASEVAKRGYETVVVAVPGTSTPAVSTVAINTDTRYATATEAADAVRAAVDALQASILYKKIDSTLRGNIGPEVAAALTTTDATLAVVAPAFPATGRQTWDGEHTVEGTPVADTEYGADPKGPASSTVADLFTAHEYPVEQVAGSEIQHGVERVAARLASAIEEHDRPPIVVCDARAEAHLRTIAIASTQFDAVYVGSGGLVAQLPLQITPKSSQSAPTPAPGAPLAVVGSVSATTLTQLEAVPDSWVIPLDPATLLEGRTERAATVADRLQRGVPTVLTAATERTAVDRTLAAGRDRGLSDAVIRDRVATGLAGIAARACRETPPSGLFYTGGDVAVAGLRALNATTVALPGATVASGVPLGRLVDGAVADLPLITKAGGFGEETAIVNCLAALRRDQ